MKNCSVLVLVLSVCFLAPHSKAVVTTEDALTDNFIAPTDDPGFANVGEVTGAISGSNSSGIYLGDRWMLTATHVGAGTTTFPGVGTFLVDGGTPAMQLSNPGGFGVSALSDLTVFRLATEPGLPTLNLSTATPAAGSSVVMIGRGQEQNPGLVSWTVALPTWTSPGADASGYLRNSTRTIRWGTNVTASGEAGHDLSGAGLSDVIGFTTVFDAGPQDEGQGALGDSGGAVFTKNGAGDWELAGVMNAIDIFSGQPTAATVYGQQTVMASIGIYQPQIAAITGIPEPSSALLIAVSGLLLGIRRRR